MTDVSSPVAMQTSTPGSSPWTVVSQGAAALAVGMGVGRFVYTPILPLMEHQAGLSASMGSSLATANYVGYFIGALIGILVPAVARSRLALRVSLLVVVVTLALMPLTRDAGAWLGLRLIAGIASALLFVIASSAMLARLHQGAQHLVAARRLPRRAAGRCGHRGGGRRSRGRPAGALPAPGRRRGRAVPCGPAFLIGPQPDPRRLARPAGYYRKQVNEERRTWT
jgi:Uncharacterised MFS-type transporter YbfB